MNRRGFLGGLIAALGPVEAAEAGNPSGFIPVKDDCYCPPGRYWMLRGAQRMIIQNPTTPISAIDAYKLIDAFPEASLVWI